MLSNAAVDHGPMEVRRGGVRLAIIANHFADYSVELALEASLRHSVLLLVDPDKLASECDLHRLQTARPRLRLSPLSQGRLVRRTAGVVAAAAALTAFRPQVVIAHEHAHPHVTWLQRLGARLGRSLLIVHDPEPHAGRDTRFAQGRAGEIAAQRAAAHALLAHGAWCAGRLQALSPDGTIVHSIPHGPILKPEQPAQAPSGRLRVLMFGRMEAYKGLEVLLTAFQRLQGSGAELEIMGDGPELACREADFSRLPGVTVTRGYASRSTLLAALARADLVVAPYLEATQSGVVAAAFANARPVLASAVGGLPDSVTEGVNGRLLAPGDPRLLEEAIRQWPERGRGLWRGALQASTGPLSWREVLHRLEPLF